MISYDEAWDLMQDMTLFFINESKKEIKGKFCNCKIQRNTLPKDVHYYEFRGGDDEYLCAIEKNVFVNFEGSFLCNEEINLGENGYLTLLNYEESNFKEADLDYSFI